MERYHVTVVAPGDPSKKPTLLVPFAPNAIVTAFIDELFRRIAKQGLQLAPNTHIATLHLDDETGAIIDSEDVLSDVVTEPKTDRLFATFSSKPSTDRSANPGDNSQTSTSSTGTDDKIWVRVVTAATAKHRDSQPSFQVPISTTLCELHKIIAQHLHIPNAKIGELDTNECNCKLAKQIAELPSTQSQIFVVHGKSQIQHLSLDSPTETVVRSVLRQQFGHDLELRKKVSFYGAEAASADSVEYKKNPVLAVCSKHRHVPAHARTIDVDESLLDKSRVLDLHTSEVPIHSASMASTIAGAGLDSLAVDGALEIFAVPRLAAAGSISSLSGIGKGAIYRAKAHWEPPTIQSQRGMAMFLSSLRVFASLVQDMSADEAAQDAIFHVFDLMCKFPPALRTLHILINGKTPSVVESAVLSHACYAMLDGFMPTTIIGIDHSRVFEGARLLFGFILEKARAMKLEAGPESLPYLTAFKLLDLRDCKSGEAVMRAVQTQDGLLEAGLHESFQESGPLAGTHLQSSAPLKDSDTSLTRNALVTGGASPEVLLFSATDLAAL